AGAVRLGELASRRDTMTLPHNGSRPATGPTAYPYPVTPPPSARAAVTGPAAPPQPATPRDGAAGGFGDPHAVRAIRESVAARLERVAAGETNLDPPLTGEGQQARMRAYVADE